MRRNSRNFQQFVAVTPSTPQQAFIPLTEKLTANNTLSQQIKGTVKLNNYLPKKIHKFRASKSYKYQDQNALSILMQTSQIPKQKQIVPSTNTNQNNILMLKKQLQSLQNCEGNSLSKSCGKNDMKAFSLSSLGNNLNKSHILEELNTTMQMSALIARPYTESKKRTVCKSKRTTQAHKLKTCTKEYATEESRDVKFNDFSSCTTTLSKTIKPMRGYHKYYNKCFNQGKRKSVQGFEAIIGHKIFKMIHNPHKNEALNHLFKNT